MYFEKVFETISQREISPPCLRNKEYVPPPLVNQLIKNPVATGTFQEINRLIFWQWQINWIKLFYTWSKNLPNYLSQYPMNAMPDISERDPRKWNASKLLTKSYCFPIRLRRLIVSVCKKVKVISRRHIAIHPWTAWIDGHQRYMVRNRPYP